INSQSFAQYSWSGSEAFIKNCFITPLKHYFFPIQGLHRPDQNSVSQAVYIGGNIKEVVNSVAEIYVSLSSFLKHYFRSFGTLSIVGMAGFIIAPTVSFSFGNNSTGKLTIDVGADFFAN